MAENLGSLVDQMIKLAVSNPKVLEPEYKGMDAIKYRALMVQLDRLQQDYSLLQNRVNNQLAKLEKEQIDEECRNAMKSNSSYDYKGTGDFHPIRKIRKDY